MTNRLEVLPPLTKSYILERITQEEIAEFYTGVPVNEITLSGNSFTSPMREDNHPTCNYYYNENTKGEVRLKLKDHNGSFHGDVFDLASFFTKISSRTGQGFALLLHKIAYDFKIHKFRESKERDKLDIVIRDYHQKAGLKVFKINPRGWNEYDKRYWYDRFGIFSALLNEGKIIPIQRLQIADKDGYFTVIYNYYSKDPAYAYYGGIVDGIKLWRIYFPLRQKGRRFLANYAFIQGLHLIKPARIGIITKSYKDALTFKTLGVQAIGLPAETYIMSKEEMFDFKKYFDIVLTNFDWDRTGIRLANKYKRVHGVLPMMFTRGKFGQPDFGVKDLSEFREQYGLEKTKQLIENLVEKYEDELLELTNYNYNSLSWIV